MMTNAAIDSCRGIITAIGNVCCLIALTLALSGCVHSSAMRLSTNPLKVRSQVLKEVPIGTPLKIAQEKMQDLGFRCEIRKAGEFGDQITTRGERGEYQRYENINYLACRKDKVVSGVSHRAWDIALVFDKDEVVTNVLVQVWNMSYL